MCVAGPLANLSTYAPALYYIGQARNRTWVPHTCHVPATYVSLVYAIYLPTTDLHHPYLPVAHLPLTYTTLLTCRTPTTDLHHPYLPVGLLPLTYTTPTYH